MEALTIRLQKQDIMKLGKPQISVAIIGHVKSGKSTLAGHLLYKGGSFSSEALEKSEQQAVEADKPSLKYAWLMDKLKNEREKSLTVEISYAHLETSNFNFTVIDTPGHKKYIKNMISGVSLADTAVLVVSSLQKEFQAELIERQSCDNAIVAFNMGVKHIIVCVNKLDQESINFSEEKFMNIKDKITEIVRRAGYRSEFLSFIPISAWSGDNVFEGSANIPWYHGPTLIEKLDQIELPKRYSKHPLRLSVQHVYNIQGVGTVAFGKIHIGVLRSGMDLTIAPTGVKTTVSSIEIHHVPLEQASSGDIVAFKVEGLTAKDIKRGDVLYESSNEIGREIETITANIVVIACPKGIKAKYSPSITCHAAHIPCIVTELLELQDKNTGKSIQAGPSIIKYEQFGLVQIKPLKPLFAESSGCPALNHILFLDHNKITCVLTIRSLIMKEAQ